MVTCRSLATRRTAAAKVAGIVTLCRTDLADDALLLVAINPEYQECTRVVQMLTPKKASQVFELVFLQKMWAKVRDVILTDGEPAFPARIAGAKMGTLQLS